jgi:hypothetical protein
MFSKSTDDDKLRRTYDSVKNKINDGKGDISTDIKRIEEENYKEQVYTSPAIIQLLEQSGNAKIYVFNYGTGEIISTEKNETYQKNATSKQIVMMVGKQIKEDNESNESDISDSDEIIINEVKNMEIPFKVMVNKYIEPIESLIKTKYKEYLKKKTNAKMHEYREKQKEEREKYKQGPNNTEYTKGPPQLVGNIGGKKTIGKKRTRKNKKRHTKKHKKSKRQPTKKHRKTRKH